MSEEDADLFEKLNEQVWLVCMQTNSPILLTAHQELTELRARLIGEEK